jgi:hypothetical protein
MLLLAAREILKNKSRGELFSTAFDRIMPP